MNYNELTHIQYVTVEIRDGNGTGCGAGKDHGARVDGFQREAGHHHC